jgi:hypothetical protein
LEKGLYQVKAVFTVDHEQSEWKGELESGPLRITIENRVEE